MEADARTDYAMLMGLFFLLAVGGGPWSIDARRLSQSSRVMGGLKGDPQCK